MAEPQYRRAGGGKGGSFSVAPEFRSALAECRDVTWDDAYFEDDDDGVGIVAVFDFDYDLMASFETRLGYVFQLWLLALATGYCFLFYTEWLALLPAAVYVLSGTPFLLPYQVRWRTYAQHVAVTRDGIRYVNDKQRSCWGCSICDRGRQSKTVPFDKITDCDIHEPAGNSCLVVPNVLTTVNVDTASSGGEGKLHELRISGLRDPAGFKKLVWAMKRAKGAGGPLAYDAPGRPTKSAAGAVELSAIARAVDADEAGEGCGADPEIGGILRDIRDELRQNNELLRRQRPGGDDRIEGDSPPKGAEIV